jgi:hypothetical protein
LEEWPEAGLTLQSLYSECGRAKMFCLVCCISPLFDTFSHSGQFRLNLNYAICINQFSKI